MLLSFYLCLVIDLQPRSVSSQCLKASVPRVFYKLINQRLSTHRKGREALRPAQQISARDLQVQDGLAAGFGARRLRYLRVVVASG